MDENKMIRPMDFVRLTNIDELNVIKDTKNHIGLATMPRSVRLATMPRLARLATAPRLVRPATVPRLTALAKTVSSCAQVLTQ